MVLVMRTGMFIEAMRKNAKEATMETAQACVANAKARVRIDTGELRDNIETKEALSEKGRYSVAWGVFSDIRYALPQEFGPMEGSGFYWGFTPYIRPAADEEYSKLPPRFVRGFRV